jgi:thiamine-phosphate pyrophosphorylase
MIVVISSPTPITKEASLINQLFDEGLAVFHLRKPESSSQELVLLLQEINPEYYSKIVLHSHHYLAKSFGINRLHFNEVSRKQLIEDALETYNAEGVILSTSIHSTDDYNQLSDKFDYAFLSPVFDSISKPNYQAQTFNLSSINKKTDIKLIALGGIDETNCTKAFEMGFDGIALLGAIWNSENKITAFKTIQSQCPIIAQ